MTTKEWLDVLASMDNPAMSAIGQGLVDLCATMTKERDALTNDGRGLRSRTYGELPESVAALIVGHEWDNMPVSDQRDWAVDVVAARDQEIKTLREKALEARTHARGAEVEAVALKECLRLAGQRADNIEQRLGRI